ncbi:hypothetical protein HZH68_009072 [Vespula germanica]|uniref:Uncharacterized protein n=1 Tax=Vespula germanica TaxID=30212 RepID=A0A834N6T7_VESGE|nr:hypothetical protein HZH68_009072 [Vespula germanica]
MAVMVGDLNSATASRVDVDRAGTAGGAVVAVASTLSPMPKREINPNTFPSDCIVYFKLLAENTICRNYENLHKCKSQRIVQVDGGWIADMQREADSRSSVGYLIEFRMFKASSLYYYTEGRSSVFGNFVKVNQTHAYRVSFSITT